MSVGLIEAHVHDECGASRRGPRLVLINTVTDERGRAVRAMPRGARRIPGCEDYARGAFY